jgi:hypothetical protein
MQSIKRLMWNALFGIQLLFGWAVYLVSGKTPPFAHQAMIGLFCVTQGRSNDLASKLIGFFKRPFQIPRARGVLGDMSAKEYRDPIVSQLRERGYYVFERCIPADLCDRLLSYAVSHPCKMRRMDGGEHGRTVETVYPRGAPQAVRYDFDIQALLNNPDVQDLLADLSFVCLAQDYLGARPTIDVLTMWWHTDFSNSPDSEAGQFFHFDMDRPKWLKFFIYLTDVGPENGPHSFVAGSHKTGGIPSSLLRKGYSRLADADVNAVFDARNVLELTAPRGSVIAEDTRGLHKGKHVEQGDRLVLQIQFSNSLFGCHYPKAEIGTQVCTALKTNLREYASLYAPYLCRGRT